MQTTLPAPAAPEDRILWQADLARRFNVDRVTVYRWEQSKLLPPPDVVLGRRRGRYESTLRAFERSTLKTDAAA